MALTSAVHDSLPYIDSEPTASEYAAAQALIDAEIPSDHHAHPSLHQIPAPDFSPLFEAEHLRIQNKQPLNGIDLTRYEAIEPPTTSPHSDSQHPETLQKWRAALAQAYTSHSYLTGRQNNLALLEEFGKNAWLIGNSQLEDLLRGLERDLSERKREIDLLAVERRNAQDAVGGEVKGLEEGWKRGVGKVLETEVAAEGVRREILESRRLGAS
jgi:pre-mRNA-splicing factor SPF27